MTKPSKIIGLTIGPKSLLLAEVSSKGGGQVTVGRLAEFVYPEALSLSTPEELGKALAGFLRGEKFSTKDVVIGLPARRLLTRRKEVPPAPQSLAVGTLRLAAEAEFTGSVAEDDGFTVDYAGQTSSSEATAVLLMATAQSCVTQCETLAKAAGLRLRGITATGAALGRVTSTLPGGDGLIVTLGAGGAELVVQHGRASTQLRHLAIGNTGGAGAAESLVALVGEIRRTVAALPRNGTPLTLAVWDEAGADGTPGAGNLLEERLGMPVTSPDLRSLAITSSEAARANAFAPTVAVAMVAMDSLGLPVDFLHSRLAPPKEHTARRPIVIASVIGAIVILAIAAGVVDLQMKQSALDRITGWQTAHAKEIAAAQLASERLNKARVWTARPSKYVTCLRDITNLFPDEGSIWATSISLAADNKGQVMGKALGEPQVRALKDKMLASKQFVNPVITALRDDVRGGPSARGATGLQSFTISFNYKPAE